MVSIQAIRPVGVRLHLTTVCPVRFRIPGSRPPRPGPRHPVRGVQEQEMGVQLERERTRADHVQVPGAVRRPQEVAHRQGGTFPVQEHVPVGKQRTNV